MATKSKKNEEKYIKLADMTSPELATKARELSMAINKKRLEMAVGRVKNIKEVFNLRRELARVKTVLNSKK